ncbi:hypothetical protein KJY78_06070 [Canibacter sp. lx-45]|uniref:hypothetical protein n=1 Tax=Canibacter zhuwentaonis TaxID=2837491 RepID=UPI001BDD5AC3|nr:hypothetical protein [Canibacter zhuwentaonis]MBT1035908.1 hypothetical protein [Canibacter zhuwentaonis]
MDKNFKDIKKKYNKLRNRERQKIVKKLVKMGFKAKGHQGTWNCTSRGKIKPRYNLGMWKWIVAKKGTITAVVSLQSIEQDSITKNIHVLFDRISVDVFKNNGGKLLSENSDSYFQSIKSRYNVENEFDPGFVEKQ